MKDPSIHITMSDFESLLKRLEVEDFPLKDFFRLASGKAINTRAVVISNNKLNKQVNKILLASKGDASLVADIIYATRIKLKHRGVRKINQTNTREWTNCKKLAEVCNNFCQDFGFENPREGFIAYIEFGIKKMTGARNLVQRLISMSDIISDSYGAKVEIDNDETPRITKEIHDYYVGCIAANTGIMENYYDQPDKYIHFVNLKNFLDERGWEFHDFIDAQFEALAFCNGIPQIDALYGDKAIERYNKFLYKNNISRTPSVQGSLWDKLKDK